MKNLAIILLGSLGVFGSAQKINGIQLFNPQTNDGTAVIGFGEQLILKFDDFENSSTTYRYTIRHRDRNWQDDGLFFTEYATGNLNGLIDDFQYSFNTLQKYTHYRLAFPNDKMKLKISGNYELIVYKTSPEKPLFTKRFSVSEGKANIGVKVSRMMNDKNPAINQRVEAQVVPNGLDLASVMNTTSLSVIQNNNWKTQISEQRPSGMQGNQLSYQQLSVSFSGNNEFYYFDNKNLNQPMGMVASTTNDDGQNHTFLYPVWAYPMDYQYQPDVNGAYYFRRNDLGAERDADREGDYSWVYFSIDSQPIDKEIFVLGQFNDYTADEKSKMFYDENSKKYIAKIYLKQGFYNYILATKNADGTINYGEVNGNFWQTENLYQAFLYYRPYGRNYDGLVGYGEFRTPIQ